MNTKKRRKIKTNIKLDYYRGCNIEFQINPKLLSEFIRLNGLVYHSVAYWNRSYGIDDNKIFITFDKKYNKILYNYYQYNGITIQQSLDYSSIKRTEHFLIPFRRIE